jgi:hypothetical protein
MQTYILAGCLCVFGLTAHANSQTHRNHGYHAVVVAGLPEPGTKVLFGMGFALIALGRVRRRNRVQVTSK